MTKLTLLADSDILIYRAAMLSEREINWGDGVWSLHATEDDALRILNDQIGAMEQAFPGADVIFALTDKDNFRKSVYPLYKANRKVVRKPMMIPFLREHILDTYRTYLRPTLEADDCIGVLATSKTIVPGDKIVYSIDKDFRTIPCRYYDFNKKVLYETSEAEADRYHLYQTLIGDATDGYPGLKGCGKVSAERLLETKGATWKTVVDAYEKAGFTEEDALVQARCARILRATDFDFATKTVRLWEPPRA